MKQLLKLTLLLLALLLPATATPHAFEVNGIYYNINGRTATVTYRGSYYSQYTNEYSGDVTIPASVTYNGITYTISSISDSAFYDNQLLNALTLPETITTIGVAAFKNCSNFKYMTCMGMIPPSVHDSFEDHFQRIPFEGLGINDYEYYNENWEDEQQIDPNFWLVLFVNTDAYSNYKNAFQGTNYFSYITSHERTAMPHHESTYLEESHKGSYPSYDWYDFTYNYFRHKASVSIYPSEESIIYTRYSLPYVVYGPEFYLWRHTTEFVFLPDFSYSPTHYNIQAFAIAEGKLPSDTQDILLTLEPDYLIQSYDFGGYGNNSNNYLYYNILGNNTVEVTFEAYDYDLQDYLDEGTTFWGEYDEYYHYSGDVIIPDSTGTSAVTTIGAQAFMDCNNLNSITIPSSITTIGYDAFTGCTGLTRVNITDLAVWCDIDFLLDPTYYAGSDGRMATNPLCIAQQLYLNGTEVNDLIIPNSVTSICDFAFYYFKGLTSVTIPNSVTEIGYEAFLGCTGLTSVTFGNSVKKIGEVAFGECTGLTSVYIPNSVTEIGQSAFYNCSGLTSISIPKSVTIIGDWAFEGCSGLNEVYSYITDPSSISMGYDVFSREPNNYDVRTLYVPYGTLAAYQNDTRWSQYFGTIVEMEPEPDFISDGVYYSITGDNKVVVSCGEEAYSGRMVIPESVTVDGVTYTVTGIADGAFANANLDFLSIPVAITDNIANNAFEDSNINSVHIAGEGSWDDGALPASVETLYIGSGVPSVEGLQVIPATIYSYASVPPACDANTFTGYDATLHVPASSLAAYFTAPYWCNFINIIGDAVEPTELTIDNDSINVLVGNQIQLNATLVPNNATPNVITWTSSNDNIATVNDGNITAVGIGECDIKARLLDKVAMCHVTVTEIAPTQITLSQEFAKMEVGSQLTLTATVLPEDATDKAVTWSTTNSAVATVDSQGNVMAIGPGECFITATCRDKQAMCHVIVVEHFINIQLDQHELLLLPNHIELLTPTVTPVSTDLAVTSTNPSVAAARLANGKIQVVGIAEGTTTIRVNSTDGYAEPDSCVVKVYTLRGDVNGDGFVNISDATLLISYLVAPSETIHQVNADTNNDGQINISDATRLISYLLTGEELEPKPDNEFETETITVNGVSFDMVSVEGGTFMMGATPEQGDEALDKEKPVHRVTVSSFAMSQTEVTQELWQAVMSSNPSHFTGDPKRPVELVSWNDCQTFIAQLNQLTGKRFRLPTEAEWEYAARGGNRYKVTRYAGSNNIDEVAWYDANSGNTTHPVATKAPNELGLYDMTGNVWEWCQDWYALYSADDQTDPTGPETGNNRVLRGGCWNGGTNYDRISFRDNFRPSGSNSSGGLRLVLDQEVVYTVNGVSFTMVPVKGGTFTMGATEEEDADHATFVASPKHQVTLSNFSIGQTEVTQELWVAVMGSNPSQDTSNLQYPVSYINWPDCDSFITKLNELTGLHFRLPTEAEWEYAAKGGANSQGFVYSGSDDLDEVAWISTNSDSHPHQVATKKANELGLYDMNGNIEEWCHDWYSLYTEDPVVNPSGPETGMSKVHRGGRWNGSAKYCRLTRRDGFSQGVKRNYMGMRLAL